MKIGNSEVDFKGLLIDGPEGCQSMEPKVMELLRVLTENAGEVMTREELITTVWGVEFGGDERLSRAISLLRKAFGDRRGYYTHIVTISRVGYRLIAPITPSDSSRPPPLDAPNSHPSDDVPRNISRDIPTTDHASDVIAEAGRSYIFPPRRHIAIAGCIAGIAAVAFLLLFSRPGESSGGSLLSRQAKMEQGYAHVANFTPKGAIAQAQDIFNDILAQNADHAGARAGLAFALFREYTHLERDPALLQRGKAHAEAALRADEHLAVANIAVAWAALLSGDFERGGKYLDRADILGPNNKFAIEARTHILSRTGETQNAKAMVDAGLVHFPNYPALYSQRAQIHYRNGDLEAAKSDLKKVIALSPDGARSYAQLAQVLHMQNRTDEAIKIVQEGLEIDETALLYNNLGTFLFFKGQYELAASAFEKTLELSGDSHDYVYWSNLADAYRWSTKKSEDAKTAYQRALQLLETDLKRYPNDDNYKSRAAMYYAKLGNFDAAHKYLSKLSLSSDSPAVMHYRAVVTHEILSDRARALAALEAALAANYPSIEILNDPELSRLRQDPDYHRLLAKTKSK